MTGYKLYGSQASLFTGKARGYLRWKGTDFEEFAVNADVMKTIILPNVGWPVVPVIETPDGRIIQDTADIVDEVERAEGGIPVMPTGPLQQFVTQLLHLFGDQWMVLPAMHYRWNYNEDWIYGEFGRSAAPDLSPEEQYRQGKENGQKFRGFVPMLGITDATIPGIEKSYEAFLADFSAHLEQHAYVFGARPSLADYALLGPLYAHLYRDPASGEIMKRLAPKVADWTERTIAGEKSDGELVGGDVIPETLLPIMARHLDEHLPMLEATNDALGTWAKGTKIGDEVPRGLGMASFSVGGCNGEGMMRSFDLFRLQAALDILDIMGAADRAEAEKLLTDIGAGSLASLKLAARLERKNCRVVLAG